MHVFYVLFEGVTWEIASKLTTGTKKYKSTIHRRVQKWIKKGIFEISYKIYLKNILSTLSSYLIQIIKLNSLLRFHFFYKYLKLIKIYCNFY